MKKYSFKYYLTGSELPRYAEVGAKSRKDAINIFLKNHEDVEKYSITIKGGNNK